MDIVLRPEQIKLSAVASGAPHRPGTVAALVRGVDYYGHDALVDLDLPGVAEPVLARVAGVPLPTPGSRVTVRVASAANAYHNGRS